jgi:quercetin dioxygenase-like cupin family protein
MTGLQDCREAAKRLLVAFARAKLQIEVEAIECAAADRPRTRVMFCSPDGGEDYVTPTDPAPMPPSLMAGGRLIFDDLIAAATQPGLAWASLRPGIEIAHLYRAPDDGPAAALLRYAPGARLPRHEHTGYEHVYVLTGSQTDDAGDHPAGSLVIHAPGTTHAIRSDRGCLVLVMWERPVRFALDCLGWCSHADRREDRTGVRPLRRTIGAGVRAAQGAGSTHEPGSLEVDVLGEVLGGQACRGGAEPEIGR